MVPSRTKYKPPPQAVVIDSKTELPVLSCLKSGKIDRAIILDILRGQAHPVGVRDPVFIDGHEGYHARNGGHLVITVHENLGVDGKALLAQIGNPGFDLDNITAC